MLQARAELPADTVVFTHFIAINAAAGEAAGDSRVVTFRPDNGSVTVLENKGNKLTLIEPGAQADTRVE